MRILIVGDVHYSKLSSIVRSRGQKYSTRLENLNKSINWAESQIAINNCDSVIYLGDFFDRKDIDCEEMTALKEIAWNDAVKHYILIGNHESNDWRLVYSTTQALQKANFEIIKDPEVKIQENIKLVFIPYIIEDNRKSLKEYLDLDKTQTDKTFVFSHNDIKGIKYGMYESVDGFDLNEINNSCTLFLNGHLHNQSYFCKNGLNVGNLTGLNFLEDSFNYNHSVFVLDTEERTLTAIENPYAFNFYKIEINKREDLNILNSLKTNAVLSIKCNESLLNELKIKLSTLTNITECRVIIYKADVSTEESVIELNNNKNYLEKFCDFMQCKLGKNEVLLSELAEVCK